MAILHDDLTTIVGRSIDSEIRTRLKAHIIKVIEPDIMEMVNSIMKEFDTQIRYHREHHLDRAVLEVLILDKREPKK